MTTSGLACGSWAPSCRQSQLLQPVRCPSYRIQLTAFEWSAHYEPALQPTSANS